MIAGKWPQASLRSTIDNNGIVLDLHTDTAPIAYGIEHVHEENPLAWPLFATEDDLRGLVRTTITVNECDPLRDEGVELYRRLLRAGVAACCRQLMGTVHASEVMCTVTPDISCDAAAAIANFCSAKSNRSARPFSMRLDQVARAKVNKSANAMI